MAGATLLNTVWAEWLSDTQGYTYLLLTNLS